MATQGNAKIILSAEDRTRAAFAGVSKNVDKLGVNLSSVKAAALGALGALAVPISAAGFLAAAKGAADYADEMGKLAQRAGVTSEAISGLAFAAKLSDVDNNTLARGLRELGNDAAEGGKKLGELGIKIADASGKAKTSEALLSDVAEAISSIESPAERAAVAAKLFGDRIGPELLPLLNSGRQGIKDMTDEAARFGRVVDDEATAKAAEFNDNLSRLQELATGAAQSIGIKLIPSLNALANEFLTGMRNANGLLDAIFTFGTIGTFEKPTQGAKQYRDELDRLKAAREKLIEIEGVSANTAGFDREIEQAQKRVAYFNDLARQGVKFDVNDQSSAEGRRLGLIAPARAPAGADAPKRLGGGRSSASTPKDPFAEGQRYLDSLKNQLQATEDLTVYEKLLAEIRDGSLGKLNPQLEEQLKNTARLIDQDRELNKVKQEFADITAEAAKAQQALKDEASGFYDATRSPIERLNIELARQQMLLDKLGPSYRDTFERASFAAQESYDATQSVTKSITELDSFTQQAAKNMQDALGTEFANILDGNFKDIGSSFTGLINKMVAEAAAAQLSKFLFGDMAKDGGGDGGILGSAFKSIAGSIFGGVPKFATGTDFVPRDMLAMVHKGEAIIPAQRNTPGSGGGGVVNNISVSVAMPQGGNRATALQFGADAARQIGRASSRNG